MVDYGVLEHHLKVMQAGCSFKSERKKAEEILNSLGIEVNIEKFVFDMPKDSRGPWDWLFLDDAIYLLNFKLNIEAKELMKKFSFDEDKFKVHPKYTSPLLTYNAKDDEINSLEKDKFFMDIVFRDTSSPNIGVSASSRFYYHCKMLGFYSIDDKVIAKTDFAEGALAFLKEYERQIIKK